MTHIILHTVEWALLAVGLMTIVFVCLEDYGKTPRITQAITLLTVALALLVIAFAVCWVWPS
jgi:predicted anti-sigma-YlaC factor YlaD